MASVYPVAPITADHATGFHACLDAVARERRYLTFVEAPPLERARKFVEHNIANNVPQFVALDRTQVVGWCDISPNHHEGFRHSGLLGMGVVASHRRRGIGSALLTATIDAARRRGMTRIELEVFADNAAAVTLYERYGFEREGVKRKARLLDGEYEDAVMMAKLFDNE